MSYRRPYVGEGADGARRSAQIDREEADTIDTGDEWGRRERDRLLTSAARWEQQADTITRQALDRLNEPCDSCGKPAADHTDDLGRWESCVESIMSTLAYTKGNR